MSLSSEPDKRKRSPTENVNTPVGKDPGLAGRGDPKAMAQLRVPQLGPRAPSATGRGPKELDTRSLKDKNGGSWAGKEEKKQSCIAKQRAVASVLILRQKAEGIK